MSTHCDCPGPNDIARDGMCPSCGVEGPDHQRALTEALAAGNPKPLLDRARAEGRTEGYEQGHERGLEVGRVLERDEQEPLYVLPPKAPEREAAG